MVGKFNQIVIFKCLIRLDIRMADESIDRITIAKQWGREKVKIFENEEAYDVNYYEVAKFEDIFRSFVAFLVTLLASVLRLHFASHEWRESKCDALSQSGEQKVQDQREV